MDKLTTAIVIALLATFTPKERNALLLVVGLTFVFVAINRIEN